MSYDHQSLLPSFRPQGKVVTHISCAKRHTVVLTADGEPFSWGNRVVTPRRVVLAGERGQGAGVTRCLLVSVQPLLSLVHDTLALTLSPSSSLPGSRDITISHSTSSLHFHKGYREVVRPLAVAVAAGFSHTTVLTSSGSVLVWASEDPDHPREVLGDLAGEED